MSSDGDLSVTPAHAAANSEMLRGFAKLLDTGQGSDPTITCGGKSFKVHSAIVASRSDFFAAACWGGSKEAQNHCIDLPKDEPVAVWTMLEYLYRLDYAVEFRNDSINDFSRCLVPNIDNNKHRDISSHELVCNAYMYGMGDKYGIHGLKAIASEKFAATLRMSQGHTEWLFDETNIGALGTAIMCIYDSTPETDKGLRDQVLGFLKLHLKRLLILDDFKAVLTEVPELSYQLLVLEVEDRPSESSSCVSSQEDRPAEKSSKKKRKPAVMDASFYDEPEGRGIFRDW